VEEFVKTHVQMYESWMKFIDSSNKLVKQYPAEYSLQHETSFGHYQNRPSDSGVDQVHTEHHLHIICSGSQKRLQSEQVLHTA